MLKKYPHTALFLVAFLLLGRTAAIADETIPVCRRLVAKATGDMAKYSVYGEANGPVFFSGINCAIKLRNKEFCAMEMSTFDATAMVYDYFTGEEVEIKIAYFWLDEKNSETPILAFGTKEGAERYAAETGGGTILDYAGLTDRKF